MCGKVPVSNFTEICLFILQVAAHRRILVNLFLVIANPDLTEEVYFGHAPETEVMKFFLRQSGTKKSREHIW